MNRYLTPSDLVVQHQALVVKKFDGGLTDVEEKELQLLRWHLKIIEHVGKKLIGAGPQ